MVGHVGVSFWLHSVCTPSLVRDRSGPEELVDRIRLAVICQTEACRAHNAASTEQAMIYLVPCRGGQEYNYISYLGKHRDGGE